MSNLPAKSENCNFQFWGRKFDRAWGHHVDMNWCCQKGSLKVQVRLELPDGTLKTQTFPDRDI